MALQSPFVPYQMEKPPRQVGVYELAMGPYIVYIGSGRIWKRLRAHDRDEEKSWNRYRCLITNDRRRARQKERRELRRFLQRHDRLPKFNKQIG